MLQKVKSFPYELTLLGMWNGSGCLSYFYKRKELEESGNKEWIFFTFLRLLCLINVVFLVLVYWENLEILMLSCGMWLQFYFLILFLLLKAQTFEAFELKWNWENPYLSAKVSILEETCDWFQLFLFMLKVDFCARLSKAEKFFDSFSIQS